jgi:hypothetical protein
MSHTILQAHLTSCMFSYVSSSALDSIVELLECSKKAGKILKQHPHVTECVLGN